MSRRYRHARPRWLVAAQTLVTAVVLVLALYAWLVVVLLAGEPTP